MKNLNRLSTILLTASALTCSYASSAYTITAHNISAYNTDINVMNANLGLTDSDLVFENFADTSLLSGLSIAWDDAAAITTLDGTFSFGSGVANWDADNNMLNNTPNNGPSGLGESNKVTFNYSAGTNLFGIGLSQWEPTRHETPTITINGVESSFDLFANPNFSATTNRNSYLVITADSGDAAISSVSFERGQLLTSDDFVLFDHVAVQGVSAVPVPAAVWLFASGLLGLVGVARRKKA